MRTVALRRIKLSGFKSFSAAREVDFASGIGLTLISGDNRAEPRLGGNGSGKSTLLGDAPCFCLFGSGVQGTRVADLVSCGQKRTSVSCTFDVDGEERTVERTGPPSRISIDGVLSEQADVDRLVGLTRRQYLNSVLYGQGMPLFIDLSIPERGDLLDEVLDLEIWMKAAKVASDRHASVTADSNRLRIEIGRTEGALSSLPDVEELRTRSAEWEDGRSQRRSSATFAEAAAMAAAKTVERLLGELPAVGNSDALRRRLDQQLTAESELRSKIAVKRSEIERIEEDLVFFRDNGECPSCGQAISRGLSEEHVSRCGVEFIRSMDERNALTSELEKTARRITQLRESWTKATGESQAAGRDRARLESELSAHRRESSNWAKRVGEIDAEENPHEAQIGAVAERREELRAKLARQKRRMVQFDGTLAALAFWKQGFRRARLFCIDRVLKQLDVEAANAARSLGLVGWKIEHATETETKAGTQRLGVQVQVRAPHMTGPFSAWSGGEGQRVRLATALGFGSLVQRWMGVRWRQEIFDEPTQFLSEAGIEDLLECLRNRADATDRRIFVMDHRGLQDSGFSQVITVVKDEEGSRTQ